MTLGARGGLFKCQEGLRKHFSQPQRCCESRASLIKRSGNIEKAVFTTVGVL